VSLLGDLVRILTLDCRESSQLLSESLDRPLRRAERLALILHGIGCWSCRRLRRQFDFLRSAAGMLEQRSAEDGGKPGREELSEEAVARIKSAALRAAEEDADGS
jgi:hypothetical protein